MGVPQGRLHYRGRVCDDQAGENLRRWLGTRRTPILIYDLDVVDEHYANLRRALPGTRVHYAVKSAPIPEVVSSLHERGCRFDVASLAECELLLARGIPLTTAVFTNPVIAAPDLQACVDAGCTTYTFDHPSQLDKFRDVAGKCRLMLRVSFRDKRLKMDLSRKFGCAPRSAPRYLQAARNLGLSVVGLSFHVGSQATNPDLFVRAIDGCRSIMMLDRQHDLRILDIGGGFPIAPDGASYDLESYCVPVRDALARTPDVEVLCEPGRYLSAKAGTLVVRVVEATHRGGRPWYFLDDGCYGALSGLIFDFASYRMSALAPAGPGVPCTLAGPTCDSIDIPEPDIALPRMRRGDHLLVHDIGAYSFASASDFNGIRRASITAVRSHSSPLRDIRFESPTEPGPDATDTHVRRHLEGTAP